MNWWWVIVLAVVLVLFGTYLSMTAGRLDRLHLRIESAERALDAQLADRAAMVLELVSSGLLDPVRNALLGEVAHAARHSREGDARVREIAESDLTALLAESFADPEEIAELRLDEESSEFLDDLAATCRRVELSRRFLNDAVRACRQVRMQRMVRWFHLAGHTPWPQTFEMDDTPPALLSSS